MSARQNLSDAGHLGQVAAGLLNLLLGGDGVQLFIPVGIWHTKTLGGYFKLLPRSGPLRWVFSAAGDPAECES